MTRHTEGVLPSHDGLGIYRQAWLPETPKAVVVLVHGLGEHSGRYAHVAAALTSAGYAVHALDHRGHGKSEGTRAFVRSYDEFMRDLAAFRSLVAAEHPALPLFVLGHSMGGNLAVGHALDHPDGLAGLVLSGAALQVGGTVSPTQIKIFKLVAKVAPRVRPQALDVEAISRDPAVVEAYRADPLVYTGKMSAGIGVALIEAMERFPARYHELTLPILVMHGTEDRLADVAGSRALEAAATGAEVTAHYYDGLYHEIFNEPERERVLGDLVTWLDAHVG